MIGFYAKEIFGGYDIYTEFASRDYEPEDPYWEKVIAVLSSMIKLTAVKQWQGFRSPLRFRKAQ